MAKVKVKVVVFARKGYYDYMSDREWPPVQGPSDGLATVEDEAYKIFDTHIDKKVYAIAKKIERSAFARAQPANGIKVFPIEHSTDTTIFTWLRPKREDDDEHDTEDISNFIGYNIYAFDNWSTAVTATNIRRVPENCRFGKDYVRISVPIDWTVSDAVEDIETSDFYETTVRKEIEGHGTMYYPVHDWGRQLFRGIPNYI